MGVISASMAIASGDADVVLAGGMESMSQSGLMPVAPGPGGAGKLLLDRAEPIVDLLVSDGLSDPTTGERMGDQAEKLALTHGITRKELDEVALLSQERAHQRHPSKVFWLKKLCP